MGWEEGLVWDGLEEEVTHKVIPIPPIFDDDIAMPFGSHFTPKPANGIT